MVTLQLEPEQAPTLNFAMSVAPGTAEVLQLEGVAQRLSPAEPVQVKASSELPRR